MQPICRCQEFDASHLRDGTLGLLAALSNQPSAAVLRLAVHIRR
jgi:hypothetical protein